VTHEIDEPVQLIRLEREYPLVVVKGEAGHRVGSDVRVLPAHHAVLGHHPPPLRFLEQVPLVVADEGIDADVVPRLLTGEERRDVALVELGRPVQRHGAPHRLASAAELGAAEVYVHFLQLVRGRRHPPEQVVGVGAHPLQVVAAARHDPLATGLVEHVVELGRRVLAPAVERAPVRHLEHRPHGVPDELVEIPGLGPLLLVVSHKSKS